MKIISKRGQKDYYDYLIGIYGADPKIVLDRRAHERPLEYSYPQPVHAFICGVVHDGWYDNGKIYWGEFLSEVAEPKPKRRFWFSKEKHDSDDYVYKSWRVGNRFYDDYLCKIGYPDKDENNIKENCPILMGHTKYTTKFPILKDVGINRILSPKTIYLQLCDWLAPKDNIVSNQTDKEKIVANGFDLKTSFRNVK